MSDPNPYAPPTVSETETRLNASGEGWKIFGDILLVHRGATLPKIDLETGRFDPSLQLYRQPYALIFRPPNSFWSYAEPHRTLFYRIRYFIREVLFWPVFIVVIFSSSGERLLWFFDLGGYPVPWIFAFFPLIALWTRLDRPKLRIEDSAKPGWLRVNHVHPDALAYLRGIANPTTSP